ncbi:MAG TPA: DoxX family protein [Flavitalea sp.]|nr:DoxX family protein [Flavitalea sp.]
MKKLLSVDQTIANRDIAILLLRVTVGALMLSHGIPKLISLFSGNIQFPAIFGLSADLSLSLAVFAEVICSFLLIFGIGTRLAAIPLIITMLVAVFYVHADDPFARQEPGILYLLPYVILFITGSGKYSIDYLLQRKSLKPVHQKTSVEEPTLNVYSH